MLPSILLATDELAGLSPTVLAWVSVIFLPLLFSEKIVSLLKARRELSHKRHLAEAAKLRLERIKLRYEIEALKSSTRFAFSADRPELDFPEDNIRQTPDPATGAVNDEFHESTIVSAIEWIGKRNPKAALVFAYLLTIVAWGVCAITAFYGLVAAACIIEAIVLSKNPNEGFFVFFGGACLIAVVTSYLSGAIASKCSNWIVKSSRKKSTEAPNKAVNPSGGSGGYK